jgi:hypothetical protein
MGLETAPMVKYVYCAWNSLKLVYLDGREVINAHAKKVCEFKKKLIY